MPGLLRQSSLTAMGQKAVQEKAASANLDQRGEVFLPQWTVAAELAERIRLLFAKPGERPPAWSKLGFKSVDFFILTANVVTVVSQTEQRVQSIELGMPGSACSNAVSVSNRVFGYTRSKDLFLAFDKKFWATDGAGGMLKHDSFLWRVENNPDTLFVLIADECHWGITELYAHHLSMTTTSAAHDRQSALMDSVVHSGAHNEYLNDARLDDKKNVVTLLVSATPYCVLTSDSRVPERHLCKDGRVVEGKPEAASDVSLHDINVLVWHDALQREKQICSEARTDSLESWLRSQFVIRDSVKEYVSLTNHIQEGRILICEAWEELLKKAKVQHLSSKSSPWLGGQNIPDTCVCR